MSNYSFLLLPKAVMYHSPTDRRGYHVCCCSLLAVHYFITKRGLITFCRIMLKLDRGNSFVVHMMFRRSEHLLSWILFHSCSFFFVFCYMHTNGILMSCLPLVTDFTFAFLETWMSASRWLSKQTVLVEQTCDL